MVISSKKFKNLVVGIWIRTGRLGPQKCAKDEGRVAGGTASVAGCGDAPRSSPSGGICLRVVPALVVVPIP